MNLDLRLLTNYPKTEITNLSHLLNKKLKKIRTMSDSVKRRASLYSDLVKIDDKKTAHSLAALQRAPSPGKKLQRIGFILFILPEPTGITNAVGGPMILAGRYLDRIYNPTTIGDIGIQTKETVSAISDFKKSLL